MTRYFPPFILIIVCLVVFALWQLGVPPLNNPVFAYDGYGMHVFGGIGYTAFQVLTARFCFPQLAFTPRFFWVQGVAAFGFLLALELLQFDDPFRHVQAEDVIAQTIGILIALLILYFTQKRRNRSACN